MAKNQTDTEKKLGPDPIRHTDTKTLQGFESKRVLAPSSNIASLARRAIIARLTRGF